MGKGNTVEHSWGSDERGKLYKANSFTKQVIKRKIQNGTWFVHKTRGICEGENEKNDILLRRWSIGWPCRQKVYIIHLWLLAQIRFIWILEAISRLSPEREEVKTDHLYFVIILTSNVVKYLVCIGLCGGYLPTVLHWVHITALPGKCLQGMLHPMTK